MTRRSRRELERAIDDIGSAGTAEATTSTAIVYEDATGAWYASETMDGPRLDRDAVDPVMVLAFGHGRAGR